MKCFWLTDTKMFTKVISSTQDWFVGTGKAQSLCPFSWVIFWIFLLISAVPCCNKDLAASWWRPICSLCTFCLDLMTHLQLWVFWQNKACMQFRDLWNSVGGIKDCDLNHHHTDGLRKEAADCNLLNFLRKSSIALQPHVSVSPFVSCLYYSLWKSQDVRVLRTFYTCFWVALVHK